MIELATLTDIAALTRQYQQLTTEMHQLQPTTYQANYSPDFFEWEKMLTDPNQAVYVQRLSDQQIVGFCHVTTARTTDSALFMPHYFAYLTAIFVQPKTRRNGTASQLIQAAQAWQQVQQLAYLELTTVGNNQAATKLYQKLGFVTQNSTLRLAGDKNA